MPFFQKMCPQKNAPMHPMSTIGPDLIEKTYPDMSSFGRWGFKTNILDRKLYLHGCLQVLYQETTLKNDAKLTRKHL